MKKRIVLVDDHKIFLEGISGILADNESVDVVGKAYSGLIALNVIRETMPDLAILDITMPGINGIEITRIIKQEMPSVKVLILSMHLDRRMIIEALKAGADGYALKESEPAELVTAVDVILSGQMYLSPGVVTLIIRDYIQKLAVPEARERIDVLSAREKEILSLISDGKSAKEISEKLCISRSTVDVHRRNLMQKLGCENLNELTRYAMREGLMNFDK
ncbi:MAG: response regulator transcription factor [Synergistes sp.]|nr:response regulator transcription factor [Synergistes sp.]